MSNSEAASENSLPDNLLLSEIGFFFILNVILTFY